MPPAAKGARFTPQGCHKSIMLGGVAQLVGPEGRAWTKPAQAFGLAQDPFGPM